MSPNQAKKPISYFGNDKMSRTDEKVINATSLSHIYPLVDRKRPLFNRIYGKGVLIKGVKIEYLWHKDYHNHSVCGQAIIFIKWGIWIC